MGTVRQEVERIEQNVSDSYTAASLKSASMPVTQNIANLASTISSIQSQTDANDLLCNYKVNLTKVTCSGGCLQNITPTPSSPQYVTCNNGSIRFNKKHSVPQGYTQLSYLYTTGGKYIETGLSGEIRWVGSAQGTSDSEGSKCVLGADNTNDGSAVIFLASRFGSSSNTAYKKWTIRSNTLGNSNISGLTYVDYDLTYNEIASGESTSTFSGSINDATVTYTNDQNFSNWYIGTCPGVMINGVNRHYPFVGNIYRQKAYQNGVLVADFIPAKRNSDGVLGMYETISGEFNSGYSIPDIPSDKSTWTIFTNPTSQTGKGVYISDTGLWRAVSDRGAGCAIPLTVGKRYRLEINPSSGSVDLGTMLRYGQSPQANPTTSGIQLTDWYRGNEIYDGQTITFTATKSYFVMQLSASAVESGMIQDAIYVYEVQGSGDDWQAGDEVLNYGDNIEVLDYIHFAGTDYTVDGYDTDLNHFSRYIDTGLNLNDPNSATQHSDWRNIKIEIDAKIYNYTGDRPGFQTYDHLFMYGQEYEGTIAVNPSYGASIQLNQTSPYEFVIKSYSGNSVTSSNGNPEHRCLFITDLANQNVSIYDKEDEDYLLNTTMTVTQTDTPSNYIQPIKLIIGGGDEETQVSNIIMDLYSVKVTDSNNVVIYNGVPAFDYNTGCAGLYDTVSERFSTTNNDLKTVINTEGKKEYIKPQKGNIISGVYNTVGQQESVKDFVNNIANCENLLALDSSLADKQEIKSGTVNRKIGMHVFNGTEDIKVDNSSSYTYRVDGSFPDLAQGVDMLKSGLSTNFAITDTHDTSTFTPGLFRFSDNQDQGIPSTYQQVEYVENAANTLVKTGVVVENSDGFKIDITCRTVQGSFYIFQARDYINDNAATAANLQYTYGSRILGLSGSTTGNTLIASPALEYTDSNGIITLSTINRQTQKIIRLITEYNMVFDGSDPRSAEYFTFYCKDLTNNVEESKYLKAHGQKTKRPRTEMCLFGNMAPAYGSAQVNRIQAGCRVYEAKLWKNNQIVLDLVPVKRVSDNAVGFYNKVDGKFLTATSGSLTAGPDVTPTPVVDYVTDGYSMYMSFDSTYNTVDKVKTYLRQMYSSGDPVIVFYPLENDAEFKITAQTNLTISPVAQNSGSINNLPIKSVNSITTNPINITGKLQNIEVADYDSLTNLFGCYTPNAYYEHFYLYNKKHSNVTGDLVFSKLKSADLSAFAYAFSYTDITSASFPLFEGFTNLHQFVYITPSYTGFSGTFTYSKIQSISFGSLQTINYGGFRGCCQHCDYLSSVNIPLLTTINTNNCFDEAFGYCSLLTSVTFTSLSTVNGNNCFKHAFHNSGLQTISFPALTTVTGTYLFGSASYEFAFEGCTALTEIHFRADAQSMIENIDGYSSKWGASNATIYFDL